MKSAQNPRQKSASSSYKKSKRTALKHAALACIAPLAVLTAQAQTCGSPNTDGDYILGTAEDAASAMHWATGLVWKRCVEGMGFDAGTGQCTGTPEARQWKAWAETQHLLPKSFTGQNGWGINAQFSQNLLESGDWRMAYKTELLKLAEGCDGPPWTHPAVFADALTAQNAYVWTGSPVASNGAKAWGLDFGYAYAAQDYQTNLDSHNPVRPVRGGQPFAALAALAGRAGAAGAQETFPPITLAPSIAGGTAWGGARIEGEGTPAFRVNGAGAWVTEAIVKSTDTITVRLTAPASVGSRHTATLTVRSGQTTGTQNAAANAGAEATAMQQTQALFNLDAVTHPIATAAQPPGAGAVTCTPNPVPHGGASVCKAASSAFAFKEWGGACAGQTGACTLANVTNAITAAATFDTAQPIARPLNDTGAQACDTSAATAQDCHHGRDAGAATGQLAKTGASADARNGFDFTPIGTPWACTHDNVTGLTWEAQAGSALHTWDAAAANTAALCGHADWRLPTLQELETLVDLGQGGPEPRIDPAHFPATAPAPYWTATPFAGDTAQAWALDFATGAPRPAPRADALRVRLVRGGQ